MYTYLIFIVSRSKICFSFTNPSHCTDVEIISPSNKFFAGLKNEKLIAFAVYKFTKVYQSMESVNLLQMTDTETTRFIELYKSEEVLWNPLSLLYRNRDSRRSAASRIAIAMGIPGFCGDQVILKFKHLRNLYSQELKKMSTIEKPAVPSNDVHTTSEWFRIMDSFIKPFVKTKPCQMINAKKYKKTELDGIDSKRLINLCDLHMEHNQDDSSESVATELFIPSSSQQKKPGNSIKEHNNYLENSMAKPCTLANSKGIIKKTETISGHQNQLQQENIKTEDSFDHFGIYIASVLRELPLRNACTLVQKITNAAMESIIDSNKLQ